MFDLVSHGCSLSPILKWESGDRKLKGYQSTSALNFRSKIDQASEVIKTTVGKGASRINSISFDADEKDKERAVMEAGVKAAQQALQHCAMLSEGLGLSSPGDSDNENENGIGGGGIVIVKVEEPSTTVAFPQPLSLRMMSADSTGDQGLPLEASIPSPDILVPGPVKVKRTMRLHVKVHSVID